MTKKQAPKKAAKKGKVKARPDKAREPSGMAQTFDEAMTRIAKAPWPPPEKK